MAILIKSETPEQDKNFWATTWECVKDAQHLYGRPFTVDVAAEPQTAKCPRYYSPPALLEALLDYRTRDATRKLLASTDAKCVGLDALTTPWERDWWCNPPFDMKEVFIQRAISQQRAGRPGMMLLPYEPLAGWWRRNLHKGVIIYEPDGRYQFYERDGKTKKTGANFGSVLVGFPTLRLHYSPRVQFNRGIHKQGVKHG